MMFSNKLESGENNKVLFGKLDENIVSSLVSSIGKIEDFQIIGHNDQKEWALNISNPLLGNKYKPPFFNRRSEYAHKHSYFEALCHALKLNKIKEPLVISSSARYAKRYEESFEALLCPATIEITSFVEKLREINREFIKELKSNIESKKIPYVDIITEGLFRNVAIQIHFNEKSLPAEKTLHLDHINSFLHMAVTLAGTRQILFEDLGKKTKTKLVAGDTYLTSPTSIWHGVEIPKLSEKDASISLQLRTLLPCDVASELYKNHTKELCSIALNLLSKYDNQLLLPTYNEYNNEYIAYSATFAFNIKNNDKDNIKDNNKDNKDNDTDNDNKSNEKIHETIVFKNKSIID